ncbi:DNA ligase [Casimicrobium huifangae]|uniref:DNA ligase n=1 Tax=Casimicrobium huifangae TaxID=2591109 RepID=UPI003783A4A6
MITTIRQRWFAALALFAFVLPACSAWAREPSLLLANVLGPHVDVTQYLVSEKFDGVRAVWDGKTLRFRSGRDVPAPAWWLAKLPATPLDGELWLARGKFDELSGIVRTSPPVDADWQRVNYLIFELPDEAGALGTFEQRYSRIQEVVARAQWASLRVVEQTRVADRTELKRRLDRLVKAGGEGLMLHLANAPYVTGRSDVLLKLKPLLDTEATVVRHVPGKGRNAGRLGALEVRTRDGIVFRLGTGFSDAQRDNPPPVGSLVTYTYRDVTPSGKPRFASFLRVRDDP